MKIAQKNQAPAAPLDFFTSPFSLGPSITLRPPLLLYGIHFLHACVLLALQFAIFFHFFAWVSNLGNMTESLAPYPLW